MTEAARLLRYARGRAGLTQRGIAAKAGVSRSSVARIDASPDALRGNGVVRPATDLGPLDLVATPSGTAGYDDLRAGVTTRDLGGVDVAVAGVEDLVRMKTAVGRLKDRLAVEALLAPRHAIR